MCTRLLFLCFLKSLQSSDSFACGRTGVRSSFVESKAVPFLSSSSLQQGNDDRVYDDDVGDEYLYPFVTDGIRKNRIYLDRPNLVNNLIEKARAHQHIVIGSPPTSLLLMLKWALRERGIRVYKQLITGANTGESLLAWLESKGIVQDEE